ncbi:hypothetical protein [Cupriavidus pauculus]
MATNDFLVFGGGAGANVIKQVTYSGLAARTAGFSSGVAQSAQLNKVWRQSSIMSAVLAQFISDRTGLDVLDDGTTATILANLKAAAAAVNGDATKTFSVAAATANAHAVNYSQVLGVGQTMQTVTGSRAIGTTYTNTTGKPIFVYMTCVATSADAAVFGQVNGNTTCVLPIYANGLGAGICFLVPAGATYAVQQTNTVSLSAWHELRT